MSRPLLIPAFALLGLLAGCSGLLKSGAPPMQVYLLRPAAAQAPVVTPVAGVLAVPRPAVQPGLDSSRIALTRPGNRLDYFSGASWGASLSQVVGALAIESLRASGRFGIAADAEWAGNTRHELHLTVRHFEAEYPDDGAVAPRARVAFECLLTSRAPRTALGRCDAEAVVPASDNRMSAIVQAMEKAAQQALAQVIERAGEAARTAP